MTELSPEQQADWQQGLAEFNRGAFFEAHESLETLWRSKLNPALKTGLQGLIQVAVACVHLQRGNEKGARGVLERAHKNLRAGTLPHGQHQRLLTAIEIWQKWLKQTPSERAEAPPWPQIRDEKPQ